MGIEKVEMSIHNTVRYILVQSYLSKNKNKRQLYFKFLYILFKYAVHFYMTDDNVELLLAIT